jgi:hypothetical protein
MCLPFPPEPSLSATPTVPEERENSWAVSRIHEFIGLAIKTNPTLLTIQAFLITSPVTVIALKDKNKAEYKKNVMIQKSKINHRPGHEVLHFDVSRNFDFGGSHEESCCSTAGNSGFHL